MTTSKFRSKIWDPTLILSQIVAMQFQFYSALLLCNYLVSKFLNIFFLSDPIGYSLSNIFDHRLVNFHDVRSTFICFSLLLTSVESALFQWRLVNRSKQCLDFTVTLLIYHILFSWIYVGTFPSTLLFWLTMIVCGIAMTVLSEYLCMQSALREIPLSFAPKANL